MPLSINLPISSGHNFLGNTCSCNRGPIAYCIYFITWYFAVVLYSFKVLNCNTSNNICIYQYLFTITLIDIWNVIFSPTTFSAAGYTELTHLNSGSYNRIMVTSNCILHAILVYKAILWFVDEDVYIFASFIMFFLAKQLLNIVFLNKLCFWHHIFIAICKACMNNDIPMCFVRCDY